MLDNVTDILRRKVQKILDAGVTSEELRDDGYHWLMVHDLKGRLLWEDRLDPGVRWDGKTTPEIELAPF